MAEARDIEWLKISANDLNNLLQVISESSKALKKLCETEPEAQKYYTFLANGLNRALGVTSEICTRVGGIQSEPAIERPSHIIGHSKSPENSQPEIINPDGKLELIMLIDDEKLVLDLATSLLIDEGYRVLAMMDVFHAISAYQKLGDQISLVILDFAMPVLNGDEVFNELKKINPRAPIVLSSGFTEQGMLRDLLARGLRGFLPKPYTRTKLLVQIRTTLDAVKCERTGERRVL